VVHGFASQNSPAQRMFGAHEVGVHAGWRQPCSSWMYPAFSHVQPARHAKPSVHCWISQRPSFRHTSPGLHDVDVHAGLHCAVITSPQPCDSYV
jgi:hypothetical protein